MPTFDACDLHIPHKNWADDDRDAQNWYALERWAFYFHHNCLPTGGAAVKHRITYAGNSFRDPSGTAVTHVPTGAANYSFDWAAAGTADGIAAGVFVPDSTLNPPIPALRLTVAGTLTFTGHVIFYGDGPEGGVTTYVDFFDTLSITSFEFKDIGVTPPAPNSGTIGMGGGFYLPAGTGLELVVRNYGTAAHVIPVNLGLTLLEG